ncbi:bi-domain-containing oxidoreductase [Fibrobacterota bacterium]
MKQVLIKQGNVSVGKIPTPTIDDNSVLIKVKYSFISSGTELAGLSDSATSVLKKIRDNPEKIIKGIDKIKQKGVLNTFKDIQVKKKYFSGTGYSCSGIVLEVGRNISDLKPGFRVACAGAGLAQHSEVVKVPRNLIAPLPDKCSLKEASAVTLGAIAMQGVRQADVKLGEIVLVFGLGLIGQLTVQLLKASGCRVIGIDLNPERSKLSRRCGADNSFHSINSELENYLDKISDANGADCAILTASTKSDSLIKGAMDLLRKRARLVVVGDVGLGLCRDSWYKKEINVKISCSYGPGRYDNSYELDGIDYPYPFVRWTENRNMSEFLRLIAEKAIDINDLVSTIYPIDHAPKAFAFLKSKTPPLGVILEYAHGDSESNLEHKIFSKAPGRHAKNKRIFTALIGAGSFAQDVHLPNLNSLNNLFKIQAIISKNGTNALNISQRYHAEYSSTNYFDALEDENIDLVFICTRHDLHADMVINALSAGKHVFVEKPLALNREELSKIFSLYRSLVEKGSRQLLLVGYNRRFSPPIKKIKSWLDSVGFPAILNYRVNAGYAPYHSWIHGPEGGGRIIGEACHMLDVFFYLTNSELVSIDCTSIDPFLHIFQVSDNFSATLKFNNGSICNLVYTSMGGKGLPKELVEVHAGKCSILLNDFVELKSFGSDLSWKRNRSNKGHLELLRKIAHFLNESSELPIPIDHLIQVSEASFLIEDMTRY